MPVDGEYFRHGENLPLPIQIPLSKKSETLCWSFIAFLKSTLIFEHFEKNEPHSLGISEIIVVT